MAGKPKAGWWKLAQDHPIWSKVIATVFSSAIIALSVYCWPILSPRVSSCWHWLGTTVAVPWWAVLFAGVLVLAVLVVIVLLFIATASDKSGPRQSTGNKLEFDGLVWRWEYDSSGDFGTIAVFCPRCDFQLIPRHPHAMGMFHLGPALYRCENCHFSTQQPQDSHPTVENRLKREIQRRARMQMEKATK